MSVECGLCGAAGGYLCPRDTDSLARRLEDLPTLYAEVDECLVPRRGGWGEIVSTHGAAGPRAPLDEDVLDTVNSARAAEAVWALRVAVQRVRWPHHSAPPRVSMAADCRWLAMELAWIVVHYAAAGELASTVRDLEGQARNVVGDPRPRPQQLGTCVAVVNDEGTVCGAPITRVPGQSRLACRQCHTTYSGAQDLLLLWHYQPDRSDCAISASLGETR